MNPLENEILEKATFYAQELLQVADENEPEITAILAEIASTLSAEMVGLEHKLKTEESLAKKIFYRAIKVFEYELKQNISEEMAIQEAFFELGERQNDVLRYTFVLPFEKYVFGFRNSLEKLKQQNYQILEDLIWNAWKNIGTSFDKGYRGINITIISSQAQKFELSRSQ